jgi:hypothetical protein
MVFGSSVANVHFDPMLATQLTGLTACNEGLHGTYLDQYSSLISEYLNYGTKCRYLIICCDFDNRGNNNLITRPDLYLSHLNRKHVYDALYAMEPQNIWCAKFLPGYKLCIEGKQFYKELFIPSKDDTLAGFKPVADTAKWNILKSDTFTTRLDAVVYSRLTDIIDRATAKGIEVYAVLTPVYKDGQALILNKDYIREKYKAAGKGNSRYHFLDYTTDTMCNNINYFYNYSHMRVTGARIFTHKLMNQIMQLSPDKNNMN